VSALNIKKGSTSHSAYNLRPTFSDVEERHTLAVLVENEPGVLARVIGLFSGRGYNIESLTVAEVDHTGHRSRITLVTSGTPQVIEQIKAQLGRIVPVHEVHDLTVEGRAVERERGSRRCGWRRSSAPMSSIPRWKASSSRSPGHPRRLTPSRT
jgi:acetolactate synthase-1/3 small subunit